MTIIGRFEVMLLTGELTQEEYEKKKKEYTDKLFELYVRDIISMKELYKKLDE